MKNRHVFKAACLGIPVLAAGAAPIAAQTADVGAQVIASSPTSGISRNLVVRNTGLPPRSFAFDAPGFSSAMVAAAGSTETLAVRARATLSGVPAAVANLSDFDFRNFQGVAADANAGIDAIAPLEDAIFGFAKYADVITSSAQATALLNVYFDRTLNLAIGSDPGVRQVFLENALRDVAFTPDPDPLVPTLGEIEIARLGASTNLILGITSRGTDPQRQGAFSISSQVTIREFASYSRMGEAILFTGSRFETEGDNIIAASESLDGVFVYSNLTGGPFDFTGMPRLADNHAFDFTFSAGVEYDVSLELGCFVVATGVVHFDAGTTASCDASRSGYWNGLTNVRGADGAPLANFRLTDSTGFDLSAASPLSPAPAADPAGVPEPRTWALLVIGFGLAGAARRQQRLTHAI